MYDMDKETTEGLARVTEAAAEKLESGVVGTYKKIEDGVVGAYKKMEDAVVGAYRKVEDSVVGAVLTDRTELDDQIERVFKDVGETDVAKTKSGRELLHFHRQFQSEKRQPFPMPALPYPKPS